MPVEATSDSDLIRMAEMAEQLPAFDAEGDKKLSVTFRMDAKHNDALSRDEGRPRFDMVEFIRIIVPGDKDNIIDRPVRDDDKLRFPTQYTRFKAGQAQVEGSPLTEETWLTKAQIEELRFFGIQTLEQLAGMADSNAQKFMGIQSLRQRARARLETIKEQAPLNSLHAELEKRDELIATQAEQLRELQERLEALEEE